MTDEGPKMRSAQDDFRRSVFELMVLCTDYIGEPEVNEDVKTTIRVFQALIGSLSTMLQAALNKQPPSQQQ